MIPFGLHWAVQVTIYPPGRSEPFKLLREFPSKGEAAKKVNEIAASLELDQPDSPHNLANQRRSTA